MAPSALPAHDEGVELSDVKVRANSDTVTPSTADQSDGLRPFGGFPLPAFAFGAAGDSGGKSPPQASSFHSPKNGVVPSGRSDLSVRSWSKDQGNSSGASGCAAVPLLNSERAIRASIRKVEVQMADSDWGAGMGLSSSSDSDDDKGGRNRRWRAQSVVSEEKHTTRVDLDLRSVHVAPHNSEPSTATANWTEASSETQKQAGRTPSRCTQCWDSFWGAEPETPTEYGAPPRGRSRDVHVESGEPPDQQRPKPRRGRNAKIEAKPLWLPYTSRMRFFGGVALHVFDFVFRAASLWVYWRAGVMEVFYPLLGLQFLGACMSAYITFHDTDVLFWLEWALKRFRCFCEEHLHCAWCILMSIAFLLFGCCQWIQVKRAWARQINVAEVITDMGRDGTDERATTARSLPPFAEGERIMPVALITGVPFLIINWVYDTRVQSRCMWKESEEGYWLSSASVLSFSSGLLLSTVTLGILEIDVVISSYVMKRYHLNPHVFGSRAGRFQWLYPAAHVAFRASEVWLRITVITAYTIAVDQLNIKTLLLGFVMDYAAGVIFLYRCSPRKEGLVVHMLAGVGLLVADLVYFVDQPNYTAPARRVSTALAYWRFVCLAVTIPLIAVFDFYLVREDGSPWPDCLGGDLSFQLWVLGVSSSLYYIIRASPMVRRIGDDLHTAASSGNLQRVKKLLTPDGNGQVLDVNAETKDYFSMTPLMLASEAGHARVIEELTRSGANVNVRNANGETSLHLAAKFRHRASIQCLIEHGANTWEQNNDGLTPVRLVPPRRSEHDFEHEEITRLLEPRHKVLETNSMETSTPMHQETTNYPGRPGAHVNDKRYYAVSAAPIGAMQLREYFPDAATADDDVPSPRLLHSVSALVVSRAAGGLARRVLERAQDHRGDNASQVPLGALRKVEEIGKGGFGRVVKVELPSDMGGGLWRWRHKPLCYALKLQLKQEGHQAYSEVLALRRLDHPFIVRLERAFQTPKFFALLLEFCPTDLNRMLCKQSGERCLGLPPRQTAKYMGQVLLALTHLHEKEETVYRDVKPENILISEQDDAKLTDFGLAKKMTSAERMTMCGTVGFMPPELGSLGPHFSADDDSGSTVTLPRLDPYKMDAYSYGITLQVTMLGEDGARRKTVKRKGPMMLPLHLTEAENSALLAQLRDNGRLSDAALNLLECLLRHDPNTRKSLVEVKHAHADFFVNELFCKGSLEDHFLKPSSRQPVGRTARGESDRMLWGMDSMLSTLAS